MYVYVYTIDPTGAMYKSYRAKPPNTLDAKASCMYAVASYMQGYAEDYGCDFEDAIINFSPESAEVRFTDWDGEDARIYFSTDAAAWATHS